MAAAMMAALAASFFIVKPLPVSDDVRVHGKILYT